MLDVHGSLESDEQLVKSHTHTKKKNKQSLSIIHVSGQPSNNSTGTRAVYVMCSGILIRRQSSATKKPQKNNKQSQVGQITVYDRLSRHASAPM